MKLRRLVIVTPRVLLQPRKWIDLRAVDHQLEVQVSTVRTAGISDVADDVTDLDLLSRNNPHIAYVSSGW